MSSVSAADTPIKWPKDSRKDDYYINEEDMYIDFFLYLVTGYKNFLTQKELKKDEPYSPAFIVESFNFNGKSIKTMHVPGLRKCPVGIDVSRAIEYVDDNNGRRAIQRLVPEKYKIPLGDAEIDMTQPNMVLLTKHGLKLFLMRCRKPKAFDVAKHFGIKIEHCLSPSKEQDTLSQIMQALRDEEMIHQFGAGKYRINLYFPKYKLAIECDELDHRDRGIGYEVEQQKHIEKLLGCTFVRFNPRPLSLQMKPINRPLRKKVQQLHYSMMTYKIVNMKT